MGAPRCSRQQKGHEQRKKNYAQKRFLARCRLAQRPQERTGGAKAQIDQKNHGKSVQIRVYKILAKKNDSGRQKNSLQKQQKQITGQGLAEPYALDRKRHKPQAQPREICLLEGV